MSLDAFTKEELEAELKRRKDMVPETIEFKFYLHNEFTRREIQDHIENLTDIAVNADIAEAIQNRFYEIGFDCVLDTSTKEVTILGFW